MDGTATLLITCPDRTGLVAGIADFLYQNGANILHADQHQDADSNLFLMRVEWDLKQFVLKPNEFSRAFTPLAEKFHMDWRLALSEARPRMAIFVSKYDHCLADLLYRHQSGELNCDIPLIIGNHSESRAWADFYKIPFHEIPVTPSTKVEAEDAARQLLRKNKIDLVILARYMQVLSPDFVREYRHRIINIHHSFLPAFLVRNLITAHSSGE